MPTVQTSGVETYYERRGAGPPVVFVHGAIVDHSQWTPQLEALADGYTTVAYDVRGHGRTGGSELDRYTLEVLADDLDALVRALGLDRPVICGLSLGGCIAQKYATTYPDRLSGLVLADTFTPGEWRWPERIQWSMLRGTIPLTRFLGYLRVEKAMVWLQERISGERVSGDYGQIERLRAEGPTMETEEFAKVIRTLLDVPRASIDLSSVAVPTLVIYGEHDLGFVKRHAAKMAAEIPDVRLVEIPGGAHVSNLDEPEAFTDSLRTFLRDRVDGEPGSDG
jgi:pimeloyl-ACP methyl ester carboxylesterase